MIYLFLLLLRIVAYLEGGAKIVSFAFVFAIITFSIVRRMNLSTFGRVAKYNFYALVLVVLIMLHGLIFSEIYIRDVAVLLTYWIWFVFTTVYFKDKTITQCLMYILITFLIYNVANYLFYKFFFSNEIRGVNSIMGMFGKFGYRVFFPLSSGANIFTSQLALNALISLYFIKISSRKTIYRLIYCFYLFILVLADSRLILFFTLIFSLIYWISLKRIVYYIKKYWLLLSLLLVASMYIFYSTTIFDFMKRPGEKTGESFSRMEIWGEAWNVITQDFRIFFGYGINGFENNILKSTKIIFEGENLQTAHNFIFQNIIDFGLLGIIIIFLVLYKILRKVIQLNSYIITILLVMIILMGTTESIPSFYSFEPSLFFITIVAIIMTNNERKINQLS